MKGRKKMKKLLGLSIVLAILLVSVADFFNHHIPRFCYEGQSPQVGFTYRFESQSAIQYQPVSWGPSGEFRLSPNQLSLGRNKINAKYIGNEGGKPVVMHKRQLMALTNATCEKGGSK
jgi:hypothetical protein